MKLIQDTRNVIFFCQIILLEISIKQKIDKIPGLYATIEEIYEQAIVDGFTFLNIQNSHIYNYNNLPLLTEHRDPFDRLLISTASLEKAVILSADEKLKLYGNLVEVQW
jgi:PIN domain nuclease of toxin-antitoxin system